MLASVCHWLSPLHAIQEHFKGLLTFGAYHKTLYCSLLMLDAANFTRFNMIWFPFFAYSIANIRNLMYMYQMFLKAYKISLSVMDFFICIISLGDCLITHWDCVWHFLSQNFNYLCYTSNGFPLNIIIIHTNLRSCYCFNFKTNKCQLYYQKAIMFLY